MMLNFRVLVYGALAAAATLGAGYWSGERTQRWGVAPDLKEMGGNLEALPDGLAGWKMEQAQEIQDNAARILQCSGYIWRRYVNQDSSDRRVTGSVVLGPPGPISLHDPDVCFIGAGYKSEGKQSVQDFKVGDAEVPFRTVVLRSNEPGGRRIKVIWAWNNGAGWKAPDYPRIWFAGGRYLFKAQFVCPVDREESDADEILSAFVSEFLPAVDKQMALPTT